MSSDEELDPKELERRKLLEDIRRRAEEAELRRIEEEEQSAEFAGTTDDGGDDERVVSSKPSPPREESDIEEGKLIELRSELAVAINRKDLPAASDIFLQLSEIIPGTREISSFEKKLRSLRQEVQEEREKARIEQEAEAGERQRSRDFRRKKIEDLYKETFSLYQQEKYDRALEKAESLLGLDPTNDEAVELRGKIEKARELARQVLAEEEQRKSKAAPVNGEKEQKEVEKKDPVPGKKDDVWGGETIHHGDVEFGIPAETETRPERPTIPLGTRVFQKVERVKIPTKPLLALAGILIIIAAGYLISERIADYQDEFSHSIMVLPGWFSPTDSIAEYMSYSLAEGIVDHLTGFPGVLVVAPQSARAMSHTKGGPASAARQIGVQYYLHWSIRTTPASVSLDLTLRDTSLVDPVWSSVTQSSLRELPTAIAEIVRNITSRTGISEAADKAVSADQGSSTNPDAYLMYLKGRFMLGYPARYDVRAAREELDLAVQGDPAFRPASAALAWANFLEYEQTGDTSLAGRAAALLAFSPEDLAGDGLQLMTRGLVDQVRSNYGRAEQFLLQAEITSPGNAEVHRRIAGLLIRRGRLEDALDQARQAVRLDPLNPASHTISGVTQIYRKNYDAALAAFEQGSKLAFNKDQYRVLYMPELYVLLQRHDDAMAILSNEVARGRDSYVNYYRLGRVYQAAGKSIDLWRETFNRSERLTREHLSAVPTDAVARSYLALVRTRLGKYEEALADIDRALGSAPRNPEVLYHAARVYAMQKQNEKALEYLLRAVEIRHDLQSISDMDFFNLQNEDGFLAVITR